MTKWRHMLIEGMRTAREVAKFLGVCHLLQKGQNVADLLHDRRSQAGSIIALNEAPQSAMGHVSNLHKPCYPKSP